MKSLIMSAGFYFHRKYPGSIIFYRFDDAYITFFSDAEKVAKILNRPIRYVENRISALMLPADEFFESCHVLSSHGLKTQSIIYRDDKGNLGIPDVKNIKEEEDLDY